MSSDLNIRDSSMIHPAAKLEIADGALAQLRIMYRQKTKLATEIELSRPLTQRIARGVKRALRNGWRIHRYPRAYWRGLRATGTTKLARADVAALEKLTEQRRHDEAIAFAAALLPIKADDIDFIKTARTAFGKAGAMSLQAQAFTALRRRADSAWARGQERKLMGRIRETESDWWPQIPESMSTSLTPVPGRVLHMLKVAMPYRQSGYTMRSKYILDSQRSAGLDPVAMTALGFPQQAGVSDPATSEVVNGTTHHYLELESDSLLTGPVDVYLDAFAAQAAARAAVIAPSVIQVHSGHRGYEPALVAVAVARALNVPLVYEVRGFFESTWSRDLDWNERGETYARRVETETRCMKAADAVVTLSESMRSEIISRGVTAAKVFVVPNGVDIAAFHPAPRSAALVEQLGLAGKFVVGYVSNLDHYREGHEILIQATARLRARDIPATALIVGDGTRREELEELAIREGVDDGVIFTGKVPHDEVLDYYRLLDIFVVPRIPERAARLVTPLKPFEAMAAGIPVVVSNLEALVEIVGAGQRGDFFEAGDPQSLADALTSLYNKPDRRAELAKRAYDWVVDERQWSANAARYAAIYDSIGARVSM
jgi:glycosyltransferase involved in cell wall biosynthesis